MSSVILQVKVYILNPYATWLPNNGFWWMWKSHPVNGSVSSCVVLHSISNSVISLRPSDAIWRHRSGSTLTWWHQAITWTNVDLSSVRPSDILFRWQLQNRCLCHYIFKLIISISFNSQGPTIPQWSPLITLLRYSWHTLLHSWGRSICIRHLRWNFRLYKIKVCSVSCICQTLSDIVLQLITFSLYQLFYVLLCD